MFEWLTDIWEYFSTLNAQAILTMTELIERIDEVEFIENNAFELALGLIRYIVGDAVYLLFFTLLSILAALSIWVFVKIVFNAIISVIPGVKGRVE